ncbi:branched-chain amino acid transport system substrate-binding protein [Microvirga lupini]|uniref:Branched-chain amino acid transport system substrate-binding protein n=1 Tax=Microvirga lupini TaxID=420324 RepID=A0A7W4VQV6_9HYPH|nr:ABC transporter substrate-binding protein [Microvirga lupini]MBB3021376.1 branched-chain amino acid transport system substrate-binding protein [Microvirga lupini]
MRKNAFLLAAAASFTMTAGTVLAQETIKVGNIVATAGPLKSVASQAVVAFDLAVEKINAAGGINGKKIELIRFDTGSDPKQASVGVRKLAQDDKVLAILGPFSSGESSVAFNDAERLKILTIPTSASTPGLTDGRKYGWRLSEDETKQFSRLLKAMKEKGLKTETAEIVYISEEVVSNTAGTKLYPALLAQAGIKHGEPMAIQYKSFDMSAQAAKILQSNPDFVAVAALPESASKVTKELRRQGYKGRIIGSQIFADPNVVELFGPEGEGTMVVAGFWRGRTPEAQEFNDKYVKEAEARGIHRLGAHHSDAQAYDSVFLLKQAMEKAGVTGNPSKLEQEREALVEAMKGIRFTGILGDNICFAGNDAELPGFVIEIKDGQWTKFAEAAGDTCK